MQGTENTKNFENLKGGLAEYVKETFKAFPSAGKVRADEMAEALQAEVRILRGMITGTIPASEQTKKAMQTSVQELCIALSAFVSDSTT